MPEPQVPRLEVPKPQATGPGVPIREPKKPANPPGAPPVAGFDGPTLRGTGPRRGAEPHQRHLHVDPRIRRLTHVDEGPAEGLQRTGDGGRSHSLGEIGGPVPLMLGHPGRGIAHGGEEGVAQPGQRHLADRAGSRPRPTASPTAESAAARSPSASAARMASVEESSSAVPPPATIRSSAVRLSRTDPPPRPPHSRWLRRRRPARRRPRPAGDGRT